jgi:spore maturation protein CgeB
MKILLASPSYEDSFAENVGATLMEMGHEVYSPLQEVHADYYSLTRRAFRALAERLVGDRPSGEETRVLEAAKSLKPDLVLSLTRGLHPEVLEAIGRACGARRVLWWGDPPANNVRFGMLASGWDLVLVKDARAVSKLRLIGRNAHLLHEAMNPRWHRPLAEQMNDRIAVVGNSYAFRQAACLRLLECGFALGIYGPQPPSWSYTAYRQVHTQEYVVKEGKSRVFGEALGCLNTFSMVEGDSLNCRAFEIAGAGGLQLIEARPAILECFEPDKEVLTFSSFDELTAHIVRARKDPAGMKAIRAAGARRAISEHTYRHRLERMFSLLQDV